MLKSKGKIIAADIINKKIFVEIDKSQIVNVNGKDYFTILYEISTVIHATIVELKEDENTNKLYYEIEFKPNLALYPPQLHQTITLNSDEMFDFLKYKIGSNISFSLNKSINHTAKGFNIDDLENLILL